MTDKKKQAVELFKLVGTMMSLIKDFNKCTITHCEKEKVEVMKDKVASTFNPSALIELKKKNKKQQNTYINKVINNKLIADLDKCQRIKCKKIANEIMELTMNMVTKTKEFEGKEITPEANKLYDEFNHYLKLQKFTDDDYKKLRELNIRLVLV